VEEDKMVVLSQEVAEADPQPEEEEREPDQEVDHQPNLVQKSAPK
jgi:hypothetical protein